MKLNPLHVKLLQLFKVDDGKHPPKDIMGRNLLEKLKERTEPSLFAFAKIFKLGPMIRLANYGADGNNQHIHQLSACALFQSLDLG